MYPTLQSLFLGNLQKKLRTIRNFELDFPRLSWLFMRQCCNLKKLPFKRGINNNQRININCDSKWWKNLDEAIIPSHPSPYSSTSLWLVSFLLFFYFLIRIVIQIAIFCILININLYLFPTSSHVLWTHECLSC